MAHAHAHALPPVNVCTHAIMQSCRWEEAALAAMALLTMGLPTMALLTRWGEAALAAAWRRWCELCELKQTLRRAAGPWLFAAEASAWRAWCEHCDAIQALRRVASWWRHSTVAAAWRTWRDRGETLATTHRLLRLGLSRLVRPRCARALSTWVEHYRTASHLEHQLRRWIASVLCRVLLGSFVRWASARNGRLRVRRCGQVWRHLGVTRALTSWYAFAGVRSRAMAMSRRCVACWQRRSVVRAVRRWDRRGHEMGLLPRAALRWRHATASAGLRSWCAWHAARVRRQRLLRQGVGRLTLPAHARAFFGSWRGWWGSPLRRRLRQLGLRLCARAVGRAARRWCEAVSEAQDAGQQLRRSLVRWAAMEMHRAFRSWVARREALEPIQLAVSRWVRLGKHRSFRSLAQHAERRLVSRGRCARVLHRHLAAAWRSWCEIHEATQKLHRTMTRWLHLKMSLAWRTWCKRFEVQQKLQRAAAPWMFKALYGAMRTWRDRGETLATTHRLLRLGLSRLVRPRCARALSTWVEHYRTASHLEHQLRRWIASVLCRVLLGSFVRWASARNGRLRVRRCGQVWRHLGVTRALTSWYAFAGVRSRAMAMSRRCVACWQRRSVVRAVRRWDRRGHEMGLLPRAALRWRHATASAGLRSWCAWHAARVRRQRLLRQGVGRLTLPAHARAFFGSWRGWWGSPLRRRLRQLGLRLCARAVGRAARRWCEAVSEAQDAGQQLRRSLVRWAAMEMHRAFRSWVARREALEPIQLAVSRWVRLGKHRSFRSLAQHAERRLVSRGRCARVLHRHLAAAWRSWCEVCAARHLTALTLARLSAAQRYSALVRWRRVLQGPSSGEEWQRQSKRSALAAWGSTAKSRAYRAWRDVVARRALRRIPLLCWIHAAQVRMLRRWCDAHQSLRLARWSGQQLLNRGLATGLRSWISVTKRMAEAADTIRYALIMWGRARLAAAIRSLKDVCARRRLQQQRLQHSLARWGARALLALLQRWEMQSDQLRRARALARRLLASSLVRAFVCWTAVVCSSAAERRVRCLAAANCLRISAARAFRALLAAHAAALVEMRKATAHWRSGELVASLQAWRRRSHDRATAKQKLAHAATRWHLVRTARGLAGWSGSCEARRRLRQRARGALARGLQQSLTYGLLTWATQQKVLAHRRRVIAHSCAHWHQNSLARALGKWTDERDAAAPLRRAVGHWRVGEVGRAARRWRDAAAEAQDAVALLRRSLARWSSRLLGRGMASWAGWVAQRRAAEGALTVAIGRWAAVEVHRAFLSWRGRHSLPFSRMVSCAALVWSNRALAKCMARWVALAQSGSDDRGSMSSWIQHAIYAALLAAFTQWQRNAERSAHTAAEAKRLSLLQSFSGSFASELKAHKALLDKWSSSAGLSEGPAAGGQPSSVAISGHQQSSAEGDSAEGGPALGGLVADGPKAGEPMAGWETGRVAAACTPVSRPAALSSGPAARRSLNAKLASARRAGGPPSSAGLAARTELQVAARLPSIPAHLGRGVPRQAAA